MDGTPAAAVTAGCFARAALAMLVARAHGRVPGLSGAFEPTRCPLPATPESSR